VTVVLEEVPLHPAMMTVARTSARHVLLLITLF
jgi:hypothetical protein